MYCDVRLYVAGLLSAIEPVGYRGLLLLNDLGILPKC